MNFKRFILNRLSFLALLPWVLSGCGALVLEIQSITDVITYSINATSTSLVMDSGKLKAQVNLEVSNSSGPVEGYQPVITFSQSSYSSSSTLSVLSTISQFIRTQSLEALNADSSCSVTDVTGASICEISISPPNSAVEITLSVAGHIISLASPIVAFPTPTLISLDKTVLTYGATEPLILTGTNFRDGMTVKIDSVACGTVAVNSPTSATCTTPAHAAGGSYDVLVTMPDQQEALLASAVSWAVDNTAPTLTQTSQLTSVTSSTNTLNYSGACENGLPVVVSGSASANVTCSSGVWMWQASSTVDGTFNYTFSQTDLAMNVTSVSAVWVRDATPPVLTWTSPTEGLSFKSSLVATGSCESGLSIHFSGTGILNSFSQTCTGGTYSQSLFLSNSEGTKNITITQTDAVGNSTVISKSFLRDNTSPVLTVTTPASSTSSTSSNSQSFLGTCETGYPVKIYVSSVYVTSVNCSSAIFNYTSNSYSSDASRVFTFEQTDFAGNVGSVSHTWTRDTTAPSLQITSSSALVTAGNTGLFSGTCESGLQINVSGGTDARTTTCTGGVFSYTTNSQTTDGIRTYVFTQTDASGNVGTVSGTWQRNTQGPVFTVTSATSILNNSNSATFSGACDSSYNIEVTGSQTTTLTCNSGVWSYTPTAILDSDYSYTLTQTNGLGVSTSVVVRWTHDTVSPVLVSVNLNSGATSTTQSVVAVSFSASDSATKVSSFCLKSVNSAPSVTDSCWRSISMSNVGVAPASSVSVSSYDYSVGLSSGTASVYIWVMDQASNISTMSASSGVDTKSIVYNPGNDPVISFVLATRTSTPGNPLSLSDQTISTGQSIYLKWKVYDNDASGLAATPIKVLVSYDNVTWSTWSGAEALSNGANGSCTPDEASTTIDNGATGCVVLTSPTSDFYQIRIQATDAEGRYSSAVANPINTAPMRVIAGNLERGYDSSARSAVFPYYSSTSSTSDTDQNTFVVTENNDIYLVTRDEGLFVIKSSDGILKKLIATTGTTTLGNMSLATLKYPYKLTLDYSGNLWIWDYDRILKLDLKSKYLTHVIGGGASTADTQTDPTALAFSVLGVGNTGTSSASFKTMLMALPDGRIVFNRIMNSANPTYVKYYVYDPQADNKITTWSISGTGISGGGAVDINPCIMGGLGLDFNVDTGVINRVVAPVGQPSSGACAVSGMTGVSYISPSTMTVDTSLATLSPVASYSTASRIISGMDGHIYLYYRFGGYILRYNSDSHTWTRVIGAATYSPTSCSDGVDALSCSISPTEVFVDKNGRIYFFEGSVLRTINSANQVVTLYGQTLNYGDGGSPLLARFNSVSSIARADNGEIFILDYAERMMRVIAAAFDNISHVAGTGAATSPVAGNTAATSSIVTSLTQNNMLINKTTAEPYWKGTTEILRIDRSVTPNVWKSISLGKSSGTVYSSADGLFGSTIRLAQDSGSASMAYMIPLAWSSRGLFTLNSTRTAAGGRTEVMYKFYSSSDSYRQSHILGTTGATSGLCAPAAGSPVAATSCGVDTVDNAYWLRPVFWEGNDSGSTTDDGWLISKTASSQIILVQGGMAYNFATLPRSIKAFTYYKGTSEEFLLYCGSSDGMLYKYDLYGGANTETAITWKLPNMTCSGKDIEYDPTNRVAYIVVSKERINGIVEFAVP